MKDIQQFTFKGNQFRGLPTNQGDLWFFSVSDACPTSTQIIFVMRLMKTNHKPP